MIDVRRTLILLGSILLLSACEDGSKQPTQTQPNQKVSGY
jgi:hypothetical protein